MKKCLNCNWDVRDTDSFCRNCGCPLQNNKKYILISVLIVLVIIAIFLTIALLIASYFIFTKEL